MNTESTLRHILGMVGNFFGHVAAVMLGLVLMVVGLAMGVTMIMLPVGLVVGLLGLCIFLGGLFARFGPEVKTI